MMIREIALERKIKSVKSVLKQENDVVRSGNEEEEGGEETESDIESGKYVPEGESEEGDGSKG